MADRRRFGGRRARAIVRVGLCALIAGTLAAAAGLLVSPGRLSRFEGQAGDLVFPRGETGDVVVVGIDAETMRGAADGRAPASGDVSRWPWPRARYADLVRRLHAAGVSVIVLDVVFAEPADGDADLAASIGEAGNVVLAEHALPTPGEPPRRGLTVASVVAAPPEALTTWAAAVGHAQTRPDAADGVVRSVPLLMERVDDRRVIPALSVAALAVSSGVPAVPVVRADGVQIAGRTVPTDDTHALRVNWPESLDGRHGPPDVLSAGAVLDGTFTPGTLAGKAVFVGVVDPTFGDQHVTPVAKGAGEAGVFVHAAAYATMSTRMHLLVASTADVMVTVFLCSLIAALAVQFLPVWLAAVASISTVAGVVVVGFARADLGTLVNFTYPLVAIVVAIPLSGATRYLLEARTRRRVSALFSQYVPEEVARELIERDLVDEAVRGQRLDVAVLFCDLRAFTRLSATLTPADVNRLLGHFYEYTTTRVRRAGGTVVQYTGDEVFAVFGAPLPLDDHGRRAATCAVALQEEVGALDDDLARDGFGPVRFGIGVNGGEVVSAHVGSTWRRQYTVLGDTVNIASRLCDRAGPGQVVVADAVLAGLDPRPAADPLAGPMKGVRDDLRVWKLVLERPPTGTADR